jgi:hypothetical protein
MTYERFIMKPIPFRRRLKNLIKELQRNKPDYNETKVLLDIFRQQFGLHLCYPDYIGALLKTKFRGAAISRVCRAALKRDSYVDVRDILRKDAKLHRVPFCRPGVERQYFYQDVHYIETRTPEGEASFRDTYRDQYVQFTPVK